MVRRLAVAAAMGGVLALGGAVAACAALVDLGPEASLREAGVVDAPVVDAPDEPSNPYPCGLPQAPNAGCNACTDQYCCGVSVACSQNAGCTQASSLLLDCVFDTTCVAQVDHQYADSGVLPLQTCVLGHCVQECFPKMKCSALALCCKDIPSDQLASKQTCTGAVNQLDEANCQSVLDNVLRPQLGAGFCGGDAGADAARD